jgi:hypothetical protein
MKLVKTLQQYNSDCIVFCESIKNNVVNEGMYLRIVYSTPTFTMNGVHLCFTITPICVEKCYNKYKIVFDKTAHKEVVEKLKYVEEDIINQSGTEHKEPHYKIYDQIKYGFLKFSMEDAIPITQHVMTIMLKISGVWETDSHYGVTYKFSRLL